MLNPHAGVKRLTLLALLLPPLCAAAARGAGFSAEETAFIEKAGVLLEVPPDPCAVAKTLTRRYRAILAQEATRATVEDLIALLEADAVPVRLAYGLRMTDAFAMYDAPADAIYLSSAAVFMRVEVSGNGCPSADSLASFAQDTVGVFAHELAHAGLRRQLGEPVVATREDELLAYAREARFLAALPGWPPLKVRHDAALSAMLRGNYRDNALMLKLVESLGAGERPSADAFERLPSYIEILEGLKKTREALEAARAGVDPSLASIARMSAAWEEGWDAFVSFLEPMIKTRPSFSQPAAALEGSRRYLAESRKALAAEKPGTLARQVAEHAVRLGHEDVAFWGDARKVARVRAVYEKRLEKERGRAGR
ncbi:MAG: hypothetical protein AUJ52_07520 [Elusimicrobia bacterium CG1_02_63_36]|nr:MAG: hypothetical protein AUJ52_07520 [Elusimicrobia bacterium CG1_02_63_36]PIP84665.1 MAG: hypothetical protein COR54_03015 [Elusimicrobia bacterium CG22_combo_CG10-13_8_21_14_all_63_91]PJA18119.1 MAG: hypothetical protein COX66_02310 [Elusimicrobia bacterium CG_4_10_14_0_2_um_filter_63_34]PJB25858.1 MAG: hypothetical protein CO113_06825 [Elusimicrobia bacterium CG_4_9_14_3_um_filter_62_55]